MKEWFLEFFYVLGNSKKTLIKIFLGPLSFCVIVEIAHFFIKHFSFQDAGFISVFIESASYPAAVVWLSLWWSAVTSYLEDRKRFMGY